MKFVPLAQEAPSAALKTEYRDGRSVGVITLGADHFFFRKLTRAYYLPYGEISRFFRRVVAVPARIGCCGGELQVENLVICREEREIAEIQLPGEKAARAVMAELKARAPQAASVCFPRQDGEERAV